MSMKQYNSKKNQKQAQETKHNIAQNMFKVKRGREKDKTLINNLKNITLTSMLNRTII